jgi:hypothetical protein
MREALHHIRKEYFDRLNEAITVDGSYVPVYNMVPSDSTLPFIKISSLSVNESDQNRDSYITLCETRIEVVTGFQGDSGGELQCNEIVDEVLNLIRTRADGYIDLSSQNFKVLTTTIDQIKYLEEHLEDRSYYRAVMEIQNKVQKL